MVFHHMLMKKLFLAGGCFWGVEAYFSRLSGVLYTEVGYANGDTLSPTYEEVCSQLTGHVEVVLVHYDDQIISLLNLLEKFFSIVDPTSWHRQGADIGSQYRTGIYFIDARDESPIKNYITLCQKNYSLPIVTEIKPLACYYKAEDYHQKYLKKKPWLLPYFS